ncbi:YhgE/Pip domain-containing protein [Enterococcus canis]|uniref:YhgE/Pip domain-containing protein n=1 Tax=Enterococcus canis TaxID=214095 RepID=A0A1L8RIQ9_9ENTE|nr:YhgE/Pip domain-containing protein [Enterococcus canis]OJG19592.1 YhgE/Pip domain-containing protein [Enterococcus canis]
MVKQEWRALIKNKFLLIVLGIIGLIPALYNLIFLGGLWNPYGNLDHLPVAVVNQDQPITYRGKQLAIGENLTKKLKQTAALDFHFVSKEEGQKGIEKGKYYMIVTIPANFSKNATTILNDHPKEMQIDYQTSQGTNLTAAKMSDSAMMQIKDQVSTQVTQMYSETLLSEFGKVGTGMKIAANGGGKLYEGTAKLNTASQVLSDNLIKLASSSLKFSDGSKILSKGLQQYIIGAEKVNAGAKKMNSGVGALAEKVPELSNGLGRLADGSQTLATGVNQYTNGVSTVANGSANLTQGIDQLAGKLPTLAIGVDQLVNGSQTLKTGVDQYVNGVQSVSGGSQEVSDGLQVLASKTNQLPQQVQSLHEGTEKLVASLNNVQMSEMEKNQLIAYTDNVESYLAQVVKTLETTDLSSLSNLTQVADLVTELSNQMNNVSENVSELSQQIETKRQTLMDNYQTDLTTNANAVVAALLTSGVTLDEDQKNLVLSTMQGQSSQTLNTIHQLSVDTTQLSASLATQKQVLEDLSNSLAAVQQIPVAQIAKVKAGADQLTQVSETASVGIEKAVNGLYDIASQAVLGIQKINRGTKALDSSVPTLVASIHQLADGSKQVTQGSKKLVEQGATISQGLGKLTNGIGDLQLKTPTLSEGVNQLSQGAHQLTDGANYLNKKSTELTRGSKQLTAGLKQVTQKLPALGDGVFALQNGSVQLVNGTGQLVANGEKLVSGAQQLDNGSQQISTGSSQLSTGEKQVQQSLEKIGDGLHSITTQLDSGAEKIKQVNTKKDAAIAIAKPVSTTHKDLDTVANNGTAMAPYMMSVALFIGTITFNLLFDAFTPKKKPTTGVAWWASKASILGAVGIFQALMVYFVLTVFLGMEVLHPVKVILFSVLVSVTFMSIVTLFNLLLGKLGSFLMLIFMIIQLASSGGTYPIELSSAFYRTINPFLPMTYSIRALREGISIGGSLMFETCLFIILLIASNLLMIIFFSKKKNHPIAFDEEMSEV